jgi:hypothetical protein
MSAPPAPSSGASDFDFLRGRWSVRNRRLQHPLDPNDHDWREFTMQVENRPILGGLGNIDLYRSSEFPDQPEWEALALRLFDPGRGLWRIWWASTAGPGQLDNPVAGRFDGDRGHFLCDDTLGGRAVKVQYIWSRGGDHPTWRQSFSFDDGLTWRPNWKMDWHRQ